MVNSCSYDSNWVISSMLNALSLLIMLNCWIASVVECSLEIDQWESDFDAIVNWKIDSCARIEVDYHNLACA